MQGSPRSPWTSGCFSTASRPPDATPGQRPGVSRPGPPHLPIERLAQLHDRLHAHPRILERRSIVRHTTPQREAGVDHGTGDEDPAVTVDAVEQLAVERTELG